MVNHSKNRMYRLIDLLNSLEKRQGKFLVNGDIPKENGARITYLMRDLHTCSSQASLILKCVIQAEMVQERLNKVRVGIMQLPKCKGKLYYLTRKGHDYIIEYNNLNIRYGVFLNLCTPEKSKNGVLYSKSSVDVYK